MVDIGEWISRALNRQNQSRAGSAIYAKRTYTKEESPESATVNYAPASSEHLLVSRKGSTAIITLNNPTKGNVLNATMVQYLRSVMDTFSADPTIQVIVLTNKGKYFCTGMDLSSEGPATTGTTKTQLSNLLSTFECINTCPKVTIALIDGTCYGGGVGLAFACDIRIVNNDQTRFILSEVKRGLIPATISKYIVREWGPSLAREAMITGRAVRPEELKRRGAVYALTFSLEEAWQAVHNVIRHVETSAPKAVSQVKELVNAVAERKGEEKKIEEVFLDMMKPSEEAKFGISEFRKGMKKVDWAKWYREMNSINGKAKL